MRPSVADAVTHALPDVRGAAPAVDLSDLQDELETVAHEALRAHEAGIALHHAVNDPSFPALVRFHQDLRDALLVEIPRDLQPWVEALRSDRSGASSDLGRSLTSLARRPVQERPDNAALQGALAGLLVFESVRLRLLAAAWQSEEFEQLGGEESDVDAIAWEEVGALLRDPSIEDDGVRPLQVMFAAASVALARDAADRATELRRSGSELREQLQMRARLRAALRELRLPEAVLLENALSSLLGQERVELNELQVARPLALEGLSRQAMDQRVSRGRRALSRSAQAWPRRKRPALFDLIRDEDSDD